MEQKIKFVIIGLVAILLGSFFFNIQAFLTNQNLTREKQKLNEENASLTQKIEAGLKDNQQLQQKIIALVDGINKLGRDREELQKKYELVDKARETLLQQLQELKKKQLTDSGAEQPKGSAAVSLTEDSYWATILRQKKDLEWQLDSLRGELKNVQLNSEQLQKEKSSLELEVANHNRDKQDIGRQLEFIQKQVEYNKKMMDSIALELVGEKNDKLQIQESLRTIKSENIVLRRQLKNLNDRKINLERKLSDAQSKNTTLERRFDEMDVLLKDKVLQLDKMNRQAVSAGKSQDEEPVELSPIVVRPQSEGDSLSALARENAAKEEGKVLAVNKESNFVIIDLGQDSGVRVGDALQVYNKDNRQIGSVEIIETRKSISACDIIKESTPIKIGDKIKI